VLTWWCFPPCARQTILPVDFQNTGEIIDDELHELIVRPLPAGVRLTAVFDSCHSGSVMDLPWSYKVDGSLEIVQIDNRKAAIEAAIKAGVAYVQGRKKEAMGFAMEGVKAVMAPQGNDEAQKKSRAEKTTEGDIIQFSGCRDDQTSADATIEGRPTGAMSFALLRCLAENPHQTYTDLLKSMRTVLRGEYTQVPQMSTAHVMDLNVPFNC
jgi:metacaspase-1